MPNQMDEFNDEVCPDNPHGYPLRELHRNRRWNFFATAIALTVVGTSFFFSLISGQQARAFTVLILILAILYRLLFASKSSVPLDENAPGLGKQIHPRTMGGILGFLHNGFRRD